MKAKLRKKEEPSREKKQEARIKAKTLRLVECERAIAQKERKRNKKSLQGKKLLDD